MAISATWLMLAGRGLTFLGDDIYYYATLVADGHHLHPGSGVEYFLAPHNGHLVVLGKLIYRALFLTFGADYTAFRAVEVAAVLLCVALFYVLVRRRLGPLAALIPSVLLLFLGYAGQSLLWPFNMHTVLALAFGLGALLALEREDRLGDIGSCALLVLSVSTVELGLAFAAGVAVSVLRRPDRMRRLWIFLVPIVLFAAWWLWARRFGQTSFVLANVKLIPKTVTDSLSAVVGSIFGVNPTGEGVPTNVTEVTAWGTALALVGVLALALRIRRGAVPKWLWVSLTAILTYWVMLAMANRPGDSTRYIFVGTLMVLLVAADALRTRRLGAGALLGAACVVALAIPPNIAKFYDARGPSLTDARNTRTEDAMLELARRTVRPWYTPARDPQVVAAGGTVFTPLRSRDYLRAAKDFGSLGFSLAEIRAQSQDVRHLADVTLVRALRLDVGPAAPIRNVAGCPTQHRWWPNRSIDLPLPRGGVVLGSRAQWPITVAVSRFGSPRPGVEIGRLDPGRWASVEIPPDRAPDRWRVLLNGPVYACPPAG